MHILRVLRPLGLTALLTVSTQAAIAGQEFAGSYLAARQAHLSGDFEAVVEYGTRALIEDPENIGLLEGLILGDLALGKITDAVPVARRLEGLDKGNDIGGLVLLADAMQREDWAAVDTLLADTTSLGGTVDDMVLAWSAIGAGKMSRATELFDKLAADPETGNSALFQKALALALVGDYEGAAHILGGAERVLRLSQGGVVAYAQVLSQLERNPDAVKLLDEAFPGTQDPKLLTLRAELAAGKPVPFDAVTGARDGLAALFFDVGQTMQGETDPALVLIYARIAGHLAPDHVGAVLLAAQVYEEMGNYGLAAEAFGTIPRTDPIYPQAQFGRVSALRKIGETEAAFATLRALTDEFPNLPDTHVSLADALRWDKKYAEAIPYYDKAIALYKSENATQWGVYFGRGISRSQSGDWDGAVDDFRKALSLSPNQPSVLNFLGYGFVERQSNLDEALDMIKRAVAARPYDGYIRDSLGWVFFRLGRYEEALEEMERAVELEPVEPVLNDHLGDVYWAVGRKREAVFEWKRALSFITDDTDLDELNPDRIRRKLELGLDKVLDEEGAEALQK